MSSMKLVLILLVLSFAACASPKKKPDSSAQSAPSSAQSSPAMGSVAHTDPMTLSCSNDSETRILKIDKKGPGCSLDYKKDGKLAEVAASVHGLKHCVESQKKIRTKLERAGFKCA